MVDVNKQFYVGDESVRKVLIGDDELVFIGGPCAIESQSHALDMAGKIKEICDDLSVPFIYKSCYDKDCRSAPDSFHGVGLDEGASILLEVRKTHAVPVVSDFSEPHLAPDIAKAIDLIQVPAYLCRQTSILRAAAETGLPVHLKKGQFMSPWNMKNSVRKLQAFGVKNILLTDRGTFFGYGQLVNDFTSLPIMRSIGTPVCFDATHSIQMPTSMGTVSGGQREFIPHLVRAAVGVGIDALFMEVHDDPRNALSDPNTVLDLKYLRFVLENALEIRAANQRLSEKFGNVEIHKNDG